METTTMRTEEKPMIARDESLRAAAASLHAAADALLAALSPAPSPAATPAAWVPSVGDVVKQMTETDAVAEIGAIRVVVSTNPLRWVYVENGAKVGGACEPKGWEDEVRFVRRATSSERAAAGLPVDESAFDEAKEREAAKVAVSRDAGDDFTRGWLARARVAAKGGAS